MRHVAIHRIDSRRSNRFGFFFSSNYFIEPGCLRVACLFVCRGIRRRRIKKISYFCAMSHASILFRKRDVCDTRFSAVMHDNANSTRFPREAQRQEKCRILIARKRSIVSRTTKSNDKSANKRLHRDNARCSDNVEKGNLISRRNRYTKEHVDCNYRTRSGSHFTVTLSRLILLSLSQRTEFGSLHVMHFMQRHIRS